MVDYTREEQIVTQIARSFDPEEEVIVSATNNLGLVGSALAQRLHAPRLKLSDVDKERGALLSNVRLPYPTGEPPDSFIETSFTMKEIFETILRGKWNMLMQPVQIDKFGNTNLLLVGDKKKPSRFFVGPRGVPENTANGARVYYVIPDHNSRVFVERVDFICGPGYGAEHKQGILKWGAVQRVFTNLGVFDFEEETGRMRIRSIYNGVSIQQVIDSTGFELVIPKPLPEAEPPMPFFLLPHV